MTSKKIPTQNDTCDVVMIMQKVIKSTSIQKKRLNIINAVVQGDWTGLLYYNYLLQSLRLCREAAVRRERQLLQSQGCTAQRRWS